MQAKLKPFVVFVDRQSQPTVVILDVNTCSGSIII